MGKRRKTGAADIDVYQADDSDPEEEQQAGQRFDNVENFQYELPQDFEDEEIDEDLAFTEEDKRQAAKGGLTKPSVDTADDELVTDGLTNGLTRDDFSDDDSEADQVYGKPSSNNNPGASPPETASESEAEMDAIFAEVSGSEGSEGAVDSDNDSQEDLEDPQVTRQAVQEAVGPSSQRKKSIPPKLRDEAVPESQYNLPAAAGTGELTLADMLASLGPQKGRLSQAHKQLTQLAKKSQPVQPPLPGPIRARKERQAGYEETKKDVTKWTSIVRVNREAPTLVFKGPQNDIPKTSTTAALTAKFKPESGMEAEVAAMLKAAGVQNEQDVEDAEQALALQAVSPEELAKRRDELAKMRSLLFKHEEKARHMSKIKSKDFHRRMKRSARLKAEKAGELNDTDFIRLQAEKAEFDRAKERLTLKHKNTSQWARRALKRGVDLHADGKKEAIAEQLRLGQELRRKVDRVDTVRGSDDESASGSDSSGSDSEDGGPREANGLTKKAAKKVQKAATGILEGSDAEEQEGSRGLFALPFMKRAQEKRKRAAEEEAKKLLAELDSQPMDLHTSSQGRRNFGLEGGVQANDADLEDELLEAGSTSDIEEDAEAKLERLRKAAAHNQRQSGGDAQTSGLPSNCPQPQSRKKKARQKELEKHADDDLEEGVWGGIAVSTADNAFIDIGLQNESPNLATEAGPPLAGNTDEPLASGQDRLFARVAAGQRGMNSRATILSSADKAANGISNVPNGKLPPATKSPKKVIKVSVGPGTMASAPEETHTDSLEERGNGDAIAVNKAERPDFIRCKLFQGEKMGYHFSTGKQGLGYYLDDKALPKAKAKKRRSEAQQVDCVDEFDLDGTIAEIAEADNAEHNTAKAALQKNAEFEAEKAAEAEKELPKIDEPSLLPGWGAWASHQKEPKWLAEAKLKAERQKQAARAGRKDAKLKAVSITEKWDKKAAKYNAPVLPYPYTSKEAFEGSMRQPLGSDFNSQHSFKEMTRPAIIKSSGVIIQPLKYSQGAAEEQRRVHKVKNGNRQSIAKVSGGTAQPQKKRKKF